MKNNTAGLVAILVMVIHGCGTTGNTDYAGPTRIDQDLRQVMVDWAKDCRQHLDKARCNTAGIDRIERVSKFDSDRVLGTCSIRVRGFEEVRSVYIHKDIPLNSYLMRAVMLHEMMHCRMRFERHEEVGLMGEELLVNEEGLADKWPELLEETYSLVK